MNSIINHLRSIFMLDFKTEIIIEEDFKSIIFKFDKSKFSIDFDLVNLVSSLNNINFDDDLISLIDNGELLGLDEIESTDTLNYYLEENANIITLRIDKSQNENIIHIYSISDFVSNLNTKFKITGLIERFTGILNESINKHHEKLVFLLHQSNFINDVKFVVENEGIVITNNKQINSMQINQDTLKIDTIENYSNVIMNGNFNYISPLCFDCKKDLNDNYRDLVDLMILIGEILSMFYLADYVIIKNEIIKIKYGNNIIQIDDCIVKIFMSNFKLGQYLRIFKWFFTDETSKCKTQKLIILRDVIGKEISDNSLFLLPATFEAIQYSFDFFVKGHTEIYLNTKQKIMSEINDMIKGYENNLNSYITSFKQSFLAILSFLFATVGLEVLKQGKTIITIVSNHELIVIFHLLLYTLSVYKLISWYEFFKKCGLINNNYEGLKSSYAGTLNGIEIEDIFEKASPLKKVMSSYKRLELVYSLFWDILIILPMWGAFYVSNYEYKDIFLIIFYSIILIVVMEKIYFFLSPIYSKMYKLYITRQ